MEGGTGDSRQLTTVQCEVHGLRYNPALHSGCVRCRKEAGEKIGSPARTAATATASATATGSGSVLPALGVALVLVAGAGGGIYTAHRAAYDAFQALLSEEYDEYGYEDEYGYGDEETAPYEETYGTEEADEPELTPQEKRDLQELRDELSKVVGDG